MLYLKVYNNSADSADAKESLVFDITLGEKLSIVSGDSAAGKSYLFNAIVASNREFSDWRYECYDTSSDKNIEVYAINNLNELADIDKYTGSLLVLDEDTTISFRSRIKKLSKLPYCLMLDRELESNLDVNVNSIYEMKSRIVDGEKQFKLEKMIKLVHKDFNESNVNSFKYFITEDTASGAEFWRAVLGKLKIVESDLYGAGSIPANILKVLSSYADGNLLIALDYDRGSAIMLNIFRMSIDFSRIGFVPLESFEEVVCNSEFILSKYPELRDRVINYRKYMSYNDVSTGKYFSSLLFQKVKVLSPLKTPKDKNAFKFYSKGMKNFKECFINDCCDFEKEDCKLNYEGSKKEAMLANKFEGLRKFI